MNNLFEMEGIIFPVYVIGPLNLIIRQFVSKFYVIFIYIQVKLHIAVSKIYYATEKGIWFWAWRQKYGFCWQSKEINYLGVKVKKKSGAIQLLAYNSKVVPNFSENLCHTSVALIIS